MWFRKLIPERHLIVPMIVACGWFMEHLDSTIMATALPAISRSMNEDPIRLNLAITSYLISLAVFIPVSGWVADRFGPRRVFQAALVIFSLASLGCGISDSLAELVAARICQGAGGAMMVPVGRLLVLRSVPKSDMVRAMAYLTMPAMLGPILGPPVGGFIVTYWSWRWIFFLNLPVGVLGIWLTKRFIANIKESNPRPLDVKGCLLSGVGLAGLVFGLEVGSRQAVPAWMAALMVATGLVCTLLYVRHARHAQSPILDLSLLKIPTSFASVTGGSLFRFGVGALPFLLPLMLQLGFGLSAFDSGMVTFAGALGSFLMRPTSRPIFRRFGFRPVLLFNTLLCTGLMAANALFRPSTPHLVIIACLLVGGFLRSLQFNAISILGYADVPPNRMSAATSFNSVAQQLSMSIGISIGAVMLHLTETLHGESALSAGDFAPAFLVVALISSFALYFFVRLPLDAGFEVSGHRRHEGDDPPPKLAPDQPVNQRA